MCLVAHTGGMKHRFPTHSSFVALLGLMVVLVAACAPATFTPLPPTASPSPELAQLQVNRELWRAKSTGNYRARIGAGFFGPAEWQAPITVVVKGGKLESFAIEGPAPAAAEWAAFKSKHDTVEKVFGLIEQAIADKAEHIEVDYDAALGFPRRVVIDPSRQMADEESYYTVDNVEILSGS